MENLKRFLGALCISAFLVSFSNASWLSELLDSANISISKESAGYYKTQASGFVSGGSIRIRWNPAGPIKLFSWRPPSVSVGCNGIDATWGSFSYMNFDQLVEKIKKLSSAAPAFATQLALSTLCKDCQAILGELESIANMINSINFDACSIALNAGRNVGEALNSAIFDGNVNDWTAGAKTKLANAKDTMTEWAAKANAAVKDLDFAYNSPSNKALQQGSLMQKVFDHLNKNQSFATQTLLKKLLGKGFKEDDVANLLRGLYGDFNGFISEDDGKGGGGVTQWEYKTPTITPENFIKVAWLGDENASLTFQNYKQPICDKDEGCKALELNNPQEKTLKDLDTLKTHFLNSIATIKDAMMTNGTLGKEDINFINNQNVPLFDMLNLYGSGRIQPDEQLLEQLSLMFFKAMIEDINVEVMSMISKIHSANSQFSAKTLSETNYQAAIKNFQDTQLQFYKFFKEEFAKTSQETKNRMDSIELIDRESKRAVTTAFSNQKG